MRIPLLLAMLCAVLPSIKYPSGIEEQSDPSQFRKVRRVHPPTVDNWSRIAKVREATNQAPLVPGDASTGMEA